MRLLLAFSIFSVSFVKASTCSNLTLFNATGSLTKAGSVINDTYSAFQWKLSNFISESPNPDAPHVSRVVHTFEVETSPFQNFSDPKYPVTGCAIFVMTFSRSWANGIYDDGTCSSVLDASCLGELQTAIKSTAAQISGTANATQEESCLALQQKMRDIDNINSTSACSSHWGGLVYTFLSAPSSASLPSSDPACTTVNANTQNSTSIFKNGWTNFGQTEGEYTAYDAALRVPTPMIVATWAKAGDSKWVDTKIMCVPANQTISAGSRNVNAVSVTSTSPAQTTTATSTGGASRFSSTSHVALFIVLAFGLTL